MTECPGTNARHVLAALRQIGWSVKRQGGSHKVLVRDGWPDLVFALHDDGESQDLGLEF
jgi:predicted RNA binding protein YcfA (HicA-like mRNA interferase family)